MEEDPDDVYEFCYSIEDHVIPLQIWFTFKGNDRLVDMHFLST